MTKVPQGVLKQSTLKLPSAKRQNSRTRQGAVSQTGMPQIQVQLQGFAQDSKAKTPVSD